MHEIYAKVLWKLIEGGKKPKEAVHVLQEVLMRRGRETLMPKIGRTLRRIAERNNARDDIVLAIARKEDERAAQKEIKEMLSQMNIDAKEVTTHIDETLIGGWRLEGREQLTDASFKKYLLTLYNRATQS